MDSTEEEFEDFIGRNNQTYKVMFKDGMIKRCMKDVPELDHLDEIIKAIKKYLPVIEIGGFHIKVNIDNENSEVFISY